MRYIFTLLFLLTLNFSFAQPNNPIGNFKDYRSINGVMEVQSVTENNVTDRTANSKNTQPLNPLFASDVRWFFEDPVAIADFCETSGNGLYQVVGYGLNTERVSVYSNTNSTPLWEYPTDPNVFNNFVSISETGDYLAAGSYHNILIWNRSGSTPVFNFNTESLPTVGQASWLDITSNGNFLVATVSLNDSSYVLGFNRTSTTPVWTKKIGPGAGTTAGINGIRLSGNDSLFIVNTYSDAYVFNTYTGALRWSGRVNPGSTSGTQFPQGISGNGNFIGLVNYSGQFRILQWDGAAYNQVWQFVEGGAWMCGNDISYDGTKAAVGTLNFLGGSSYDGKVRLFRIANGNTPVFTYTGMGDEVEDVKFSENGNLLVASSWGDYGTNQANDLVVFKTWINAPTPIYAFNGAGSFFSSSISDNGMTVMGSGKRVHARQFGNGAQVYNFVIDTNDIPVGLPGTETASEFSLSQNYPNPFNPTTIIDFVIPKSSNVKLSVYDILGNEVAILINGYVNAGKYGREFDGSNLSSGLYFYKLEANGFTETKKMLLVK
jgi:hypothetical protein